MSKNGNLAMDVGAGANGVNSKTNVLVRYAHTFKYKHWSVAGSFEFPSSSINADGEYTKACDDYVPDLAAFAQYQWAGGESHVRLSGLFRVLTYRDLVTAKNHDIVGWGAQVSTVLKVIPQLHLYGIASVGQGHASYTTDLGIDNFDLAADPHTKGKLYAPTAVGYVFGVTYYFKSNIFADLALSEQRYYPKEIRTMTNISMVFTEQSIYFGISRLASRLVWNILPGRG